MTQLLKRWEERVFDLLGQEVRLKVKAPMFDEAPEFLRKMTAFGRAGIKAEAAAELGGEDAVAEGADSMFAAIDTKWARDVFTKCVQPAEPILVEDDGPGAKPIQTGADLYEIANTALVLQVLYRVQTLVMLGKAEGKVSSSPSMSAAETAPDPGLVTGSGNSPATSIEPVDGPIA